MYVYGLLYLHCSYFSSSARVDEAGERASALTDADAASFLCAETAVQIKKRGLLSKCYVLCLVSFSLMMLVPQIRHNL